MKKLKKIIIKELNAKVKANLMKRLVKLGYKDKHIASVWHEWKELNRLSNHDLNEILNTLKLQDYLSKPKEPITMVYGKDYTIVED